MPRARVTEIETLRRHLLIWVPLGAVLIASASALFSLIPFFGSVEQTAREQVLHMCREAGRSIEELLHRYTAVARQIASRTAARDLLVRYERGLIGVDTLRPATERVLHDAMETSADLRGVVRFDSRCRPVATVGRALPSSVDTGALCRLAAPAAEGPIDFAGEYNLVITVPLLTDEGDRVGTDVFIFSLSELNALLRERAALGTTGEAWVAFRSDTGERLYGVTGGQEPVGVLQPSAPAYALLRAAREELIYGYGSMGPTQDSILALVPIRGLADWQLLLRMDEDVVFGPLRRQLVVNMLSAFLLSGVGGLLLYLFMRPLAGGIVVKAKTLRDEVDARTAQLRELNGKLRELTDIQTAVLASADNIIIATDLRGVIFLFNAAAERRLGYPMEEVSGKMTPVAFHDPMELERRANALSDLYQMPVAPGLDVLTLPIRKQQRERYEWTYVSREGRRIPVLIGGSVLQNPNRETYGYVFVATDISELKRVREELETMARTDGLTGVSNRRFLEEEAKHVFASSRRHDHSMAALILDLDHFKSINDNFGHEAGDRVLKEVAAACQAQLRTEDLFGRFGGEEFLVVLPEAGAEQARHAAERLRVAVEKIRPLAGERELQVTVSIGGAVLQPADAAFADLLRRADQALYEAKEGGRNRTVVASGLTQEANS